MVESKHTPGPWLVEYPLGPEILCIVANADAPAYEWTHIAQLSTECDDDTDPTPEQAQANARLLASAPDLLRIAKRLDAFWSEEWPEGPEDSDAAIRLTDETLSIWREFRAAIAKATGIA